MFEYIYFARPDSRMNGQALQVARGRMGEILWREAPVEADLVIAVPDSGNPAARGLARAAGLPQDDGFVKNRYVARTFIQPGQELRKHGLRLKFNPLPEVIAGRRLVVVDDSIVRGNTTRQIVQMLRDAGAREVHMRISAPPIKHPCHYGIDMSTREEMIAHGRTTAEVAAELGCDSLHYLSLEGVYEAVGAGPAGANPLRRLLQRRVPARRHRRGERQVRAGGARRVGAAARAGLSRRSSACSPSENSKLASNHQRLASPPTANVAGAQLAGLPNLHPLEARQRSQVGEHHVGQQRQPPVLLWVPSGNLLASGERGVGHDTNRDSAGSQQPGLFAPDLQHVLEVAAHHRTHLGSPALITYPLGDVFHQLHRSMLDVVKVVTLGEAHGWVAAQCTKTNLSELALIADVLHEPQLELVDLAVVDAIQIGRREATQLRPTLGKGVAPVWQAGLARLPSVTFDVEHGSGPHPITLFGETLQILDHRCPLTRERTLDRLPRVHGRLVPRQ